MAIEIRSVQFRDSGLLNCCACFLGRGNGLNANLFCLFQSVLVCFEKNTRSDGIKLLCLRLANESGLIQFGMVKSFNYLTCGFNAFGLGGVTCECIQGLPELLIKGKRGTLFSDRGFDACDLLSNEIVECGLGL